MSKACIFLPWKWSLPSLPELSQKCRMAVSCSQSRYTLAWKGKDSLFSLITQAPPSFQLRKFVSPPCRFVKPSKHESQKQWMNECCPPVDFFFFWGGGDWKKTAEGKKPLLQLLDLCNMTPSTEIYVKHLGSLRFQAYCKGTRKWMNARAKDAGPPEELPKQRLGDRRGERWVGRCSICPPKGGEKRKEQKE